VGYRFSDRGGKTDMMSGMASHLVFISTFTVTDGLADTVAATEWP
jgi:hypothetical protein